MNAEQIAALGARLVEIAAMFSPAHAGALRSVVAVVGVASELNDLVRAIRDNDPEMWAQVSADYGDALAGFQASVTPRPE